MSLDHDVVPSTETQLLCSYCHLIASSDARLHVLEVVSETCKTAQDCIALTTLYMRNGALARLTYVYKQS